MHIMYVIQHDQTRHVYFGRTSDLKRRLAQHNAGLQTSTKRESGVWHLVYAEAYRDKRDAVQREDKLKQHGSAKYKLYIRIKHSMIRDRN